MIAFQLILMRVQDVSEEACDADSICVITSEPVVGEGFEVLLEFHLRIGCVLS